MAGAGSQLESHFPEAQQIDLTVVRDDTAPFAARPERFRPPFPLFKLCGAKGNRTPDLLDANETRYQLRYSP
jgi:hypothetical protein